MPDLIPRGPRFLVGLVLLGLALVAGCQHAVLTGVEPTARSFYDDPDFRQTFIGVDVNFVMVDPAPHVPPATRAAFER